jgi:hypothetical protein
MSVKEAEGYSGKAKYPIRLCYSSLDEKDLNSLKAVRKISDLGIVIVSRENKVPLVVFADGGNHEAKKDAIDRNLKETIKGFEEGQLFFDDKNEKVKSLLLPYISRYDIEDKEKRTELVFDAISPKLLPLPIVPARYGNGSEGFYIVAQKKAYVIF